MACPAAYAGHSGSPASGSAPDGSAVSASHTGFSVSFAAPGRRLKGYVANYLKVNDDELGIARERSERPFRIIDSVMAVYNLPGDLRYLAVIESDLEAAAVSRVGAKGPWQLMAGTARDLGLKVSRRYDERTNYYKSTHAAALYLRDLHREFKDWLLVIAAYNAGPVPVERAIRLAGSRNFWAIERYLPAETRQHVKRFIATAYYFKLSGPVENMPANSVCRFSRETGSAVALDHAATGFGLKAFVPGALMPDARPVGLIEYELGQNELAGDKEVLGAGSGRPEFVRSMRGAARREEETVAVAMRD